MCVCFPAVQRGPKTFLGQEIFYENADDANFIHTIISSTFTLSSLTYGKQTITTTQEKHKM